MKKMRSGGSRSHVVGERTPRFPVSYSHDNVNGDKYLSLNMQGLRFDVDGNDSDVGHENLIVLAEDSQRGGSPQLLRLPKRMVAEGDMGGDDLEGSMETDNGNYPQEKRYMMKSGNKSTFSQKGRRLYGKRLEVDNDKNSQDEIREACSGTEGHKLGMDPEKFEIEVTNGKTVLSGSVEEEVERFFLTEMSSGIMWVTK